MIRRNESTGEIKEKWRAQRSLARNRKSVWKTVSDRSVGIVTGCIVGVLFPAKDFSLLHNF
jgi:hypothetical protein